jgi:hypothetical protein
MRRPGILFRLASDTPIRLWSGQVRDIAIAAGGPETTEGAIYQSHGMLGAVPQINTALNGEADRLDFIMSGVEISGTAAALAHAEASLIRRRALDLGLVFFDEDWQQIGSPFWLASYTADCLTVAYDGTSDPPTRTIKISAGNVFTARKQQNLSFFTQIDQQRRSIDDTFFSEQSKLQEGTTKPWGLGG